MDNKHQKLREPTDEELGEMISGIIQENRDHGHIPPRSPKCNQCKHRIPKTSKCSLLYPQGIPKEIITEKRSCEEFKQQSVEEKLKEMFQEIIQENHDHSIQKTIRPKCNDCQHRIPRTAKCSLLYPDGIPNEILVEEPNCKEFKQK